MRVWVRYPWQVALRAVLETNPTSAALKIYEAPSACERRRLSPIDGEELRLRQYYVRDPRGLGMGTLSRTAADGGVGYRPKSQTIRATKPIQKFMIPILTSQLLRLIALPRTRGCCIPSSSMRGNCGSSCNLFERPSLFVFQPSMKTLNHS